MIIIQHTITKNLDLGVETTKKNTIYAFKKKTWSMVGFVLLPRTPSG